MYLKVAEDFSFYLVNFQFFINTDRKIQRFFSNKKNLIIQTNGDDAMGKTQIKEW